MPATTFSIAKILSCYLVVLFLANGCIRPRPDLVAQSYSINPENLPTPNAKLDISGLGPCIDISERTFSIDTNAPVIILVHGCFGSAGKFRALAEVFAFHGQQTFCFSYDDRADLTSSAAQLRKSIQALSKHMHSRNVTVIGHSLGGLVARKALTSEMGSPLSKDLSITLATISAPFSGIYSSSHCGSTVAMVLTLGMAYPLCRYISGEKWHQITPASDFINEPGELSPQVKEHLVIVTDEQGSCRRQNAVGECLESDYVFCLDEQYNSHVTRAACASTLEIQAGHVGIVGDNQRVPSELIDLLQQTGIMNTTQLADRHRFNRLLSYLY